VRTAVTGGSGVVGAALVSHLVREEHQVAALARSGDSARRLQELGATPHSGDVLDLPSLRAFVDGVDRVFHLAGVNDMCSPDPNYMDLVNIEGTRNVIRASREAGVGRLIHTSSAVTIGERHGSVGTETTPHRGGYLSRYERSKHLSEQVVFEEAGDLDVVVVNPSSVQGPGRSTGTGRLILDALQGRLPFLVETSVSIVDIDDCARGHILAAEDGATGQRYILSGATFGVRQALELLNRVTGRELSPRFLPGWVASVGAGAMELGASVVGRRPRVCREMVRVLRAGHVYDGSRATRELGLNYTSLEVTIRRTVDWFETEGLLA
jgi:dihydroflavonol-4-reductase